MSDVTISGLDQGSPSKSTATIPFSDGVTTYRAAPSGIVAASPGCILQVVFRTASTQVIHTATYADVISLAITIKGTNSRVLINTNQHVYSDTDAGFGFKIKRDTSDICIYTTAGQGGAGIQQIGGAVNAVLANYLNFQYLDTGPLTQNQTYTYKGQGNKLTGSKVLYSNLYGDRISTMTLMEIAG